MPYKYDQMIEAEDGNSLVLTIDETIQHYLEKAPETAVVENNVKKPGCWYRHGCQYR